MADLTNLSDEELEQAIAELSAGESVDTGGVFGETAGRRAVDNLLNLGPATGDTLAAGAAFGRSLDNIGEGYVDNLYSEYREEQDRFPASLLRKIPSSTSFDVEAGIKTLFGPGEFEQYRDEIVEESLQRRAAAPKQTFFGDLAGNVLGLATTRTPFQRGLRNRAAAKVRPDIAFGNAQIREVPTLTPRFWEGLRNIGGETSEKLVRGIMPALRRTGETSLEAALVSSMNDNDPLVAGALGAGSQVLGGGALGLSNKLFGKDAGRNIAIAAAGTLSFLQLFKEATPGGRDRILESSETAFAKLAALITVGGLAGLGGLGRIKGNLRTQSPEIADLITTLPRSNLLSLFSAIAEDTSGESELVLEQLMKDPNYFGPTAQRRFDRALMAPGAPSLPEQIEMLKADGRFKKRLNALREPSEYERLLESAPTHQIDRSRVRD